MSIQSTNAQSARPTTSANRSSGRQHHDADFLARGIGAERDIGAGYGNRGYASSPDYLRARYASNSGSHRFRIS